MYDKNNRSLFEKEGYQPLADRIRPNDFNNIYGQSHVIGDSSECWSKRNKRYFQ